MQTTLRNKTVEMLKHDPVLFELYNKSVRAAAGENRFRDFGQLKAGTCAALIVLSVGCSMTDDVKPVFL